MAIDPQAFWDENFYNHPALTDAMIADAEAKLGVQLPPELIALLRIQNGGYTKGFAFPMSQKTSYADDHIILEDLGGIVTDLEHETAQNILHTECMTKEWGLPPKQVLLSGDGHSWISLDYRQGAPPAVAWIDVESDEDIRVAASFKEFLDGLVPGAAYAVA